MPTAIKPGVVWGDIQSQIARNYAQFVPNAAETPSSDLFAQYQFQEYVCRYNIGNTTETNRADQDIISNLCAAIPARKDVILFENSCNLYPVYLMTIAHL